MGGLFRKLFLDGEWNIAIRKSAQRDSPFSYEGIFVPLPKIKGYWFADPMIFKAQGKNYLFCEAFNKKENRGDLAVFEIDNGKCNNFKIIISKDYHISYPCVFEYRKEYYMIPESGENFTLDLYRAENFPYGWVKIACLDNGRQHADPTVFTNGGEVYVITYEKLGTSYCVHMYRLDMSKKTLKLISDTNYSSNIGRPAGYCFDFADKLIHPVQNCSETYGKSIYWKEINFNGQEEKIIGEIRNEKVTVGNKKGVDRIHTYTRSDEYEVIDYNNYHFDLFKRFKIIKRAKAVKKRRHSRTNE